MKKSTPDKRENSSYLCTNRQHLQVCVVSESTWSNCIFRLLLSQFKAHDKHTPGANKVTELVIL